MAVIIGGDLTEVSWSNSLGAGFFFPVAGTESTINTGGYRGNDSAVIDGGGRLINSMNLKPWSAKLTSSTDMGSSTEFETASAIAALQEDTTWTFTFVNGIVYKGAGVILGDVEMNGDKSTFMLNVTGSGFLAQQ